jgi:hypothetical protein
MMKALVPALQFERKQLAKKKLPLLIGLVRSDQKVRTLPRPKFCAFEQRTQGRASGARHACCPGPKVRNNTGVKSRLPKTPEMPLAQMIVPPEIERV